MTVLYIIQAAQAMISYEGINIILTCCIIYFMLLAEV